MYLCRLDGGYPCRRHLSNEPPYPLSAFEKVMFEIEGLIIAHGSITVFENDSSESVWQSFQA